MQNNNNNNNQVQNGNRRGGRGGNPRNNPRQPNQNPNGQARQQPNNNNNQQQQNANPQQPVVVAPARTDNSFNDNYWPYKYSHSYVFGPEGEKTISKIHEYLKDKLKLSKTTPHPHPHGAFWRKYYDQAIMCKEKGDDENPDKVIVDVGSHYKRTTTTKEDYLDGQGVVQNGPWSRRVYMTLPVIDVRDILRHKNWNSESLINGIPVMGQFRPTDIGHCACAASELGICHCGLLQQRAPNCQVFKSIDSAYYDGVLVSIFHALRNAGPNARAYLVFHDYKQALNAGSYNYTTQDKEMTVELDHKTNCVKMSVHGNPSAYKHRIINTQGDTWAYQHLNRWYVCEVVRENPMGAHRYVLAKMVEVDKDPSSIGIPIFTSLFANIKQQNHTTQGNEFVKFFGSLAEKVSEFMTNRHVIIKILDAGAGTFMVKYFDLEKKGRLPIVAFLQDVERYRQMCIGKDNMLDYVALVKRDVSAKMLKNEGVSLDQLWNAAKIAWDLTARDLIDLTVFSEQNQTFKDLKQVRIDGKRPHTNWDFDMIKHYLLFTLIAILLFNINTLFSKFYTWGASTRQEMVLKIEFDIWSPFLTILTVIMIKFLFKNAKMLFIIFLVAMGIFNSNMLISSLLTMVNAQSKLSLNSPSFMEGIDLFSPFAYTISMMLLFRMKNNKNRVEPHGEQRYLEGTCVTDHSRLDKKIINERTKIRTKNITMDPRNFKSGEDFANFHGCDCKRNNYAWQVSPVLMGSEMFTPTIKHNCLLTNTAAAIRACSNQVYPDPDALAPLQKTLKTFFFKLKQYTWDYNTGSKLTVDFDDWLKKYPIKYREQMKAELNSYKRNGFMYDDKKYQAFPKIEKQFTTVIHDNKDQKENDVKERQISGPSNQKKIIGNAFVNQLEKISERVLPGYCGSKNWEQLAEKLSEINSKYKKPVWMAADGSGFDNTQVKEIHEMVNPMICDFIDTANIELPNWLDKKVLKQIFLESVTLKVDVMRGELKYEVDARASGDGWTTWLNSILQLAYWTTVFELAVEEAKIDLGYEDAIMMGQYKPGFQPVKIEDDDWRLQYSLNAKGDDMLASCEELLKPYVDKVVDAVMCRTKEAQTKGFGQIVKFVKWGPLDEMDFLSAHIFKNLLTGNYRLMRMAPRVFQLTPWSTSIPRNLKGEELEKYSRSLCYANGLCILSWAKGLAIYESYGKMLCRISEVDRNLNKDLENLEQTMVELKNTETYRPEDRKSIDNVYDYESSVDWMCTKYSITPNDIKRLEDKFDSATHIFSIIHDELFDVFQRG